MTDSEVTEAELEARLPGEWRIEGGDDGAYGYADGRAQMETVDADEVAASFSVHSDGDLWAATWKERHELGSEIAEASEHVTGTRERCVEWVIEKAAEE